MRQTLSFFFFSPSFTKIIIFGNWLGYILHWGKEWFGNASLVLHVFDDLRSIDHLVYLMSLSKIFIYLFIYLFIHSSYLFILLNRFQLQIIVLTYKLVIYYSRAFGSITIKFTSFTFWRHWSICSNCLHGNNMAAARAKLMKLRKAVSGQWHHGNPRGNPI